MDQLRKHFRVRIIESDAESITFDMIGIDAPIANAIRRILLSEVRLHARCYGIVMF